MLIGKYKGIYNGKTMCGFRNNMMYMINISKDLYGYTIESTNNLSSEEDTDACINYASEISIKRNWNILEEYI